MKPGDCRVIIYLQSALYCMVGRCPSDLQSRLLHLTVLGAQKFTITRLAAEILCVAFKMKGLTLIDDWMNKHQRHPIQFLPTNNNVSQHLANCSCRISHFVYIHVCSIWQYYVCDPACAWKKAAHCLQHPFGF